MCRLLFMPEPLASNSNNSSNNNHSIQQREAETANKEVRMPFPCYGIECERWRSAPLHASRSGRRVQPARMYTRHSIIVVGGQQQKRWPTKSAATTKHIETMNSRNCLAQSCSIRSDFCWHNCHKWPRTNATKKRMLCTRSAPPTDSQLNFCRRFITFRNFSCYTGIQHSTGYSINGILGIQHTTDPNGNSIKRKRIDGK